MINLLYNKRYKTYYPINQYNFQFFLSNTENKEWMSEKINYKLSKMQTNLENYENSLGVDLEMRSLFHILELMYKMYLEVLNDTENQNFEYYYMKLKRQLDMFIQNNSIKNKEIKDLCLMFLNQNKEDDSRGINEFLFGVTNSTLIDYKYSNLIQSIINWFRKTF